MLVLIYSFIGVYMYCEDIGIIIWDFLRVEFCRYKDGKLLF